LEAAIEIEPMNKGFAELKRVFAQVSVDAAACGFVWFHCRFQHFALAYVPQNSGLFRLVVTQE
jgi:hypothetical protein